MGVGLPGRKRVLLQGEDPDECFSLRQMHPQGHGKYDPDTAVIHTKVSVFKGFEVFLAPQVKVSKGKVSKGKISKGKVSIYYQQLIILLYVAFQAEIYT